METNIGIWEIVLVDDGTLDTVLITTMRTDSDISYVSRFSQEQVANFRDDDGYLTEEGFTDLAEAAADYAYECQDY